MGWRRVDDQLDVHPKVLELAELGRRRFGAAMAMWVLAGCPASRSATGSVSLAYIRRVPIQSPIKAMRDLVSVGLCHELDDGSFSFNDWHDYNPTPEQRETERANKTARQRRWRDKHRTDGDGHVDASTPGVVRRPVDAPPSRPVPARPDPVPTQAPTGGVQAPLARVPAAPLAEVVEEPPKPKRKRARKKGAPAPSSATWDAYSAAYLGRYGVEPVRNARVNGQLAQLVGRVGAEEAPEVARYYLEHNGPFYVTKGHPVGLLVADAEKLRMEWATGRRITSGDAREAERRDNFAAQGQRLEALEKALDEKGGIF